MYFSDFSCFDKISESKFLQKWHSWVPSCSHRHGYLTLLFWDLCRDRLPWPLVQEEGRCSPRGNQEEKGKDEWLRMPTRTYPSHPPPQSPCHRQKFLSHQQLPNKYSEVYINYKHSTNKLFQLNPFPLIYVMPQGSWLLPRSHFVCPTHFVSDWPLPRLYPSLPNILCLVVTPHLYFLSGHCQSVLLLSNEGNTCLQYTEGLFHSISPFYLIKKEDFNLNIAKIIYNKKTGI